MNYLYVGLGGFLGAISRFFLHEKLILTSQWNIALINILGCFLFGVFHKHLEGSWQLFILVGFIASFTTFSTFISNLLQELSIFDFTKAFLLFSSQVFLGLLFLFLGKLLAEQF